MASQALAFKSKPSFKDASLTLLEGAAYGGVLIGADLIDENQLLDKTDIQSATFIVPVATMGAGFLGQMMLKGRMKQISRDLQLMSGPVAVFRIGNFLRREGVFGKVFKKKASNLMGNHYRNPGSMNRSSPRKHTGLVDVSMSSIDMI